MMRTVRSALCLNCWLQVGFGEAGAEVIADNIKSGGGWGASSASPWGFGEAAAFIAVHRFGSIMQTRCCCVCVNATRRWRAGPHFLSAAPLLSRPFLSWAGDLNPMVPGRKVAAIFGFCDIRSFTGGFYCLLDALSWLGLTADN